MLLLAEMLTGGSCMTPDVDPDWWYIDNLSDVSTNNVRALNLCYSCPVLAECRRFHDNQEHIMETGAMIGAGLFYNRKGIHKPSARVRRALNLLRRFQNG